MSNPITSFDKEAAKVHLRKLVRKTAEEIVNAMLDEEEDSPRPTATRAFGNEQISLRSACRENQPACHHGKGSRRHL